MPSFSDNVPSFLENVPSYSDNVPSFLENVPSFSDNVPFCSDNVPSFSDNVPYFSDLRGREPQDALSLPFADRSLPDLLGRPSLHFADRASAMQ